MEPAPEETECADVNGEDFDGGDVTAARVDDDSTTAVTTHAISAQVASRRMGRIDIVSSLMCFGMRLSL